VKRLLVRRTQDLGRGHSPGSITPCLHDARTRENRPPIPGKLIDPAHKVLNLIGCSQTVVNDCIGDEFHGKGVDKLYLSLKSRRLDDVHGNSFNPLVKEQYRQTRTDVGVGTPSPDQLGVELAETSDGWIARVAEYSPDIDVFQDEYAAGLEGCVHAVNAGDRISQMAQKASGVHDIELAVAQRNTGISGAVFDIAYTLLFGLRARYSYLHLVHVNTNDPAATHLPGQL
jgi:hypothetical protein